MSRSPSRFALIAGALGSAAVGALLFAALRPPTAPAESPPRRLSIAIREGRSLAVSPSGANRPMLAIAPDGGRIALVLRGSEGTHLYLREISDFDMRRVPDSENARLPFFSPDGRWIAFFAHGRLKKTPVGGGAVIELTDAGDPWGGVWLPNGQILYTPAGTETLWRVSEEGGEASRLTTIGPDSPEQEHDYPAVLAPDGSRALMSGWSGGSFADAHIAAVSVPQGELSDLDLRGSNPHYVSTGHLVYARAEELFAVAFDPETLEMTGNPVSLLSDVFADPFYQTPIFAVSTRGDLLYAPGGSPVPELRLLWIDRAGRRTPIDGDSGPFAQARLSPDGTRIAYRTIGAVQDIWIRDLRRGVSTRLTSHPNEDGSPVWSDDGSAIAFTSTRDGRATVFVQRADGAADATRLAHGLDGTTWDPNWSPAGGTIAFGFSSGTNDDLYVTSTDGSGGARAVATSRFSETEPAISPDGRWLAFASNESGRYEIYLAPIDGEGARQQVSKRGGRQPFWSRRGDELFYRSLDDQVLRGASVDLSPTPTIGLPRDVLATPDVDVWDIDLENERFLAVDRPPIPTITEVRVVLDFATEIERRVPRE